MLSHTNCFKESLAELLGSVRGLQLEDIVRVMRAKGYGVNDTATFCACRQEVNASASGRDFDYRKCFTRLRKLASKQVRKLEKEVRGPGIGEDSDDEDGVPADDPEAGDVDADPPNRTSGASSPVEPPNTRTPPSSPGEGTSTHRLSPVLEEQEDVESPLCLRHFHRLLSGSDLDDGLSPAPTGDETPEHLTMEQLQAELVISEAGELDGASAGQAEQTRTERGGDEAGPSGLETAEAPKQKRSRWGSPLSKAPHLQRRPPVRGGAVGESDVHRPLLPLPKAAPQGPKPSQPSLEKVRESISAKFKRMKAAAVGANKPNWKL